VKRKKAIYFVLLTASGAAGVTPTAFAAADSGDSLNEIVVTAQKREEVLKDVPISLVVVSADELNDRHITSLEDLPSAVPGLSYASAGNSHYIQIRGISDIVGSNSTIGMYIDDADVTLGGAASAQINPVTYDLERVEVLRGPQGTLYGDGSSGGTIRFITKNPQLNHFSFDADVEAMFTEDGGPSQRINAMINVPLIEGQLGIRVASTFERDGGWINEPAADQENINAQNLTNVRLKALWLPSSQLTVSGMAIVNRDERGMDFSDSNSPSTFTQVFGLTTVPKAKNDYELYDLTVAYDFSSVARLTNTLGYLRLSAPQFAVSAFFLTAADSPPAETFNYYVAEQDIQDTLLTDEMRLTSTGSGPWKWTLGGFFRRYTDAVDAPENYFDFPGVPGTLPAPYGSSQQLASKSWSLFGDTSYLIGERLTIGAGVRGFRETQHFNDYLAMTAQEGDFHSVDPRFYAQFKLTDEINLYTSAAKGFRSGGFNSFSQPSYDPENVWSYELGTKMAFPESRIEVNADIFYSDYKNYQTFAPLPGAQLVSAIQNVGQGRIRGVEGDVSWRPAAHWRLQARGDFLDAKFIEINSTSTAYLPGDRIDLVPEYQFTLSAENDSTWLGKKITSRVDYSQQGPETYRNRTSGDFYHDESDTIQMLSFHTRLNWNDNLSFTVFAQNLLNDQGFTNPYAILGNGVRSRPRTIGVGFSTAFE
jgi:iron complex outermembrane recepter protein